MALRVLCASALILMEIAIGTKFYRRNGTIATVVDVLKTFNSANELVETRYLCEHDFMGQKVKHKEVAVTILKNRLP